VLDGVSLDQLRTFIAAADEGSFSAAGRRLRRAQSVVSQVLAKLEGQLGVRLFDRSARLPVLTDQGRALLSHLGAKLAFLRAGLGFGVMPLHLVEADLASGALVQITAEDAPPEGYVVAMSAIYCTNSPPGPAGRWFIDRLKHGVQPLKQTVSRPRFRSTPPRRAGDRPAVRSRRVSGVVGQHERARDVPVASDMRDIS
jgi:DNA-binding transcriptional LysR family regulator